MKSLREFLRIELPMISQQSADRCIIPFDTDVFATASSNAFDRLLNVSDYAHRAWPIGEGLFRLLRRRGLG